MMVNHQIWGYPWIPDFQRKPKRLGARGKPRTRKLFCAFCVGLPVGLAEPWKSWYTWVCLKDWDWSTMDVPSNQIHLSRIGPASITQSFITPLWEYDRFEDLSCTTGSVQRDRSIHECFHPRNGSSDGRRKFRSQIFRQHGQIKK